VDLESKMANNTSIVPFSSVHSISKWVKIFYILTISFTLISSASLMMEINLLSLLMSDENIVTDEEIDANDLQVGIISVITFVVSITALILFYVWYYKVYRNLPSLGGKELKSSPRRAVIYFFIPILWFYKPYRSTVEIWKVSDPSIPITDNDSRRQMMTPSLIKVWWAFWIISGLIGNFYLRALPYIMSADTLQEYIGLDYIDLYTNIPIVISDLLTFFLVREISTRLEKKTRPPLET
jgi:hypothetical protein